MELLDKEKELIESIIGYPIEEDKEVVETIVHRLLTFKKCSPFYAGRNFATAELELYAEGTIEPTHVIPDKVLMALRKGQVHVYPCEECIKELESQPIPHGSFTRRLPHSSFIGKSIVMKFPHDDDHILRVVYCTKPGSTHHYDEIIGKDDVNYEKLEEVSTWKC